MSMERRLAELERRVLALSSTIRTSPGASTAGGAEFIRAPQMGFPAKLTSVYNATTGYNWEMRTLTSSGGVQDGGDPLTGTRAWEVAGRTDLASGDYVWLEPAPTGQGYLFYSPAGGAFTPTFASSNSGYDPSSTTFADTGVTVTLPAAGVYLVFASTRATVQASAFGGASSGVGVYIKLRNATAAADIAGTTRHTCYTQVVNRDAYGSALVQSPITATGATEIRLQAARYDATGLATFTVASIEEAYMWYLRLS